MSKLDTPQVSTDKWASAMSAATPQYNAGIDGVQVSPGVKAAAASAKWLARTQAALPKFEANSAKVDLQQWKTITKAKAATRLASGAAEAKPKVLAFQTSFFQFLKQGQAGIDAMPTDTLDQALAKANAQARYNHSYPGYR